MENLKKTIGANIKARRVNAGMTAQALAEAIGVKTGQAVSAYERGKVDISIETIIAICVVLNCTIADLVADYMPQARGEGGEKPRKRKGQKAFNVWFSEHKQCCIEIFAKNEEEALEKFDNCDYRECDIEYRDSIFNDDDICVEEVGD